MAGICFVLCNMKRNAITFDLCDFCGNHYFTPPPVYLNIQVMKSLFIIVAVEIVAEEQFG